MTGKCKDCSAKLRLVNDDQTAEKIACCINKACRSGFDFHRFFEAYVECALWSTNDGAEGQEEPLDKNHTIDDLDSGTRDRMIDDCVLFYKKCYRLIQLYFSSPEESAGHDFWLTRNGHGAGFWDREEHQLPEAAREALTEAANEFGEFYLYAGDDGKVYC